MRFIFHHHDVQGPVGLQDLWAGTHGLAGSVGRLRILFWLAARGHEVTLAGNVRPGTLRGVEATAGISALRDSRRRRFGSDPILVILNNPPREPEWARLRRAVHLPIVVWSGNPLDLRWLERARSGEIARIVCVSQWHRNLYRIFRGFEKVEVAYSGVDLDLLAGVSASKPGAGAVLFCSIPRRTKGLHNLLRAWRVIRRTLPEARLRICGSARMHDPALRLGRTGILDKELESEFPEYFAEPPLSLERQGITLLGCTSNREVFAEIKSAAVAVVNCNWRGSFETYCRAAVEAQAAGTPVVGAARGALTEVVDRERTGLLVDQESTQVLGRAIVRLLRGPGLRNKMKTAGPSWSVELGDYALLAPQWEGIARRAMTGESAPCESRWPRDLMRRIGYGRLWLRARDMIRGSRLEGLLTGRDRS